MLSTRYIYVLLTIESIWDVNRKKNKQKRQKEYWPQHKGLFIYFFYFSYFQTDSSGLDNDNVESGIGTATPPKEQVRMQNVTEVNLNETKKKGKSVHNNKLFSHKTTGQLATFKGYCTA